MARYLTKEKHFECPGCKSRFTERELIPFDRLTGQCPACKQWNLIFEELLTITGDVHIVPIMWDPYEEPKEDYTPFW